LCDLGPNVVVRRHARVADVPSPDADRLTLTGRANETVYVAVTPQDLVPIVHAHLDDDTPAHDVTREVREPHIVAPTGSVAERMRALRHKRALES
jgi:(2Fe-2S) ferredoxin